MERFDTRLRKSRQAIGRESQALLQKTREASTAFGRETQRATRRFGRFVDSEVRSWRQFIRRGALELVEDVTVVGRPRELELRLWRAADLALVQLEDRVRSRVQALEAGGRALGRGTQGPPIEGYESLSAKAIVARLAKLTPEGCRAVYELESRTKKRATVLKAAEQRLAA